MLHKLLGTGDIHQIYQWEYANQTAREAATGFISSDVGKVALQQDNNSLWHLVSISPITWKDVGTGSADGDVVGPSSATANAVALFNGITGKLIKNSTVTVDGSGNISTSGTVDGRDVGDDGARLDNVANQSSAEGPDVNAYKEALPSGSAFPTSIIWWTTVAKTVKISEKTITWSGAFPSVVVMKSYVGGVLSETTTDTYDYTGGNLLTPKITRVVT